MNFIDKETATAEVNGWLDEKKYSARKREENKEHVERLIGYVEDGILIFDENKIVQTLKFPFGEETTIDKLEYKKRLTVEAVQLQMQNVKASDTNGMILAYAAALTIKPKGFLKKLDTEDYSVLQSIVVFFL